MCCSVFALWRQSTAEPFLPISEDRLMSNPSFYAEENGNTSLKDHGFGAEWAERASKLVFQDVENPTEDNVVTFTILTLFWYSQGSWRRAYVHKGN